MNISKNMEAIFLAAATLACFTGHATAGAEPAAVPAKVAYSQVDGVQTVTITAKRLDDGV